MKDEMALPPSRCALRRDKGARAGDQPAILRSGTSRTSGTGIFGGSQKDAYRRVCAADVCGNFVTGPRACVCGNSNTAASVCVRPVRRVRLAADTRCAGVNPAFPPFPSVSIRLGAPTLLAAARIRALVLHSAQREGGSAISSFISHLSSFIIASAPSAG